MTSEQEERPTHTQPRPNISTEHQEHGDARRPADTLDRDVTRRAPAGQPAPDSYKGDGTRGGEPREER